MGKVYVDDIGTKIRAIMSENLTNITSMVFEVKKPDGSEVVWSPISTEDVAKGIVFYDTIAGDQDQVGTYYHQCYTVWSNGDEFRTETKSYVVHKKFG